MGLAVLAASLVVAAVLAAGLGGSPRLVIAQLPRIDACASSGSSSHVDDERYLSRAWQYRAAAALAGVGLWAMFGGFVGVLLGVVVAVVGPRVLAKMETKSTRQRRQRLEAAAPMVADLLAVCLAAGTAMPSALRAVGQTCAEPAASILRLAVGRLELGADAESTWATLGTEPAFAPIARAALRSEQSGAPLADVLLVVADELRQRHRAKIEAAAKSVGVRAVGPLGACFLPAFMLLGVVPLVASLLQRVIP